MRAYGPFPDEQLFYYGDKSILILEQFQIYDSLKKMFIGLDDLQAIYNKGKKSTFNNIFFAGIANIDKPDILCQRGFDLLYEAVRNRHPSTAISPAGFERRCKEGEVMVEIICQLKYMPVAYLTERPANSLIVYSNNFNNFNRQRCYIANTLHIKCFSQSEQTLQFAMIEKFVLDTTKKFKEIPRAQRDVHWLVKHYMSAYKKAFHHRQRPTLHRAAVYDYFAVYAELLDDIFTHKIFPMDLSKWAVWVAEAREYQEAAIATDNEWGTVPLGRLQTFPNGFQDIDEEEVVEDQAEDQAENAEEINIMDVDIGDSFHEPLNFDKLDAPGSSSEEDVPYTVDHSLIGFMQRRLLKRMPLPGWYWECDLDADCTFVINLNGPHRTADARYMTCLNEEEKTFLIGSSWRLLDKKVRRIWKKICQTHWDEHMEETRLIVDHANRRIVEKSNNET